MSDRDSKGLFVKGNSLGQGRPKGGSKWYVKDLTWESINRIAHLIFSLPHTEMIQWVEDHKEELTTAEIIYLDAIQDKRISLRVVELLLDRILGKYLQIDDSTGERNPLIERLYSLGDGGLAREIDELIRVRNIIDAETQQIESAKRVGSDTDSAE